MNDPQVTQLDLIEEILSGGAGRFFSEVREKRGLSYTVGAFGFDGIEPGGFILYALADPEQIPVIRTVVLDEMEHLQKVRIPEEELQQAKQGLLGSKRIARQTQESVATEMSLNELCGLGYDYSERYEEILKKTTAEDILRLAQKLFDTSRCVVIIGQPAKTPLLSH